MSENCCGANFEKLVGIVTATLENLPALLAVVVPICSVWNRSTTRSPPSKPSPLKRTVVPPGPLSRSEKSDADVEVGGGGGGGGGGGAVCVGLPVFAALWSP